MVEGVKEHGASSLLSLSIKMKQKIADVYGPSLSLTSFCKLKIIESDGNLIKCLLPVPQTSDSVARILQKLPPLLETWRLLSHPLPPIADREALERQLSKLILTVPIPESFTSVVSFTHKAFKTPSVEAILRRNAVKRSCNELSIGHQGRLKKRIRINGSGSRSRKGMEGTIFVNRLFLFTPIHSSLPSRFTPVHAR